MSRLSLCLLGPFRAAIDGQAVTGFRSDKVRALRAYLVVESDTPHRRERLAGLLWPDRPERSARADLRVALANLRQVLGDHEATPPFLLISRQTIQFNQASDAWIDAQSMKAQFQASQPTIELQEEAVDLYRGEFMAGFSLPDSPLFEEWALLTREQLHRLAMEALHRLVNSLEQRGG
jgi:DNA-binding SARP family transcriptional activator